MEHDIIERMRREEAELVRKLEAVRALLNAYGATAADRVGIGDSVHAEVRKRSGESEARKSRTREKMPLDRFSAYGRSVVEAALAECAKHPGSPIATRDMLTLIEQRGIEVRGEDKVNAVSALLARSSDLKPNGRRGWTLASPDDFTELLLDQPVQKEEEPRSASAGGSSADRRSTGPAVTITSSTPSWPSITS